MKDSKVFKKNPDIVTRKIADDTILMPLYSTSEDIDCIYTMNEAAARFFELIDGKKDLAKIKKALLKEFDVTEKELEKRVTGLLKDLEEIKAVL